MDYGGHNLTPEHQEKFLENKSGATKTLYPIDSPYMERMTSTTKDVQTSYYKDTEQEKSFINTNSISI